MAAIYDELEFRTALDAQWAAFFDLAGWSWRYNPAPVGNWRPDFRVTFPCGHSECAGTHTLLVAVIDAKDLTALNAHPALAHVYGVSDPITNVQRKASAGALFGSNPTATSWEMSHGAGGGLETVEQWADLPAANWARAARLVTHT